MDDDSFPLCIAPLKRRLASLESQVLNESILHIVKLERSVSFSLEPHYDEVSYLEKEISIPFHLSNIVFPGEENSSEKGDLF